MEITCVTDLYNGKHLLSCIARYIRQRPSRLHRRILLQDSRLLCHHHKSLSLLNKPGVERVSP